VSACGCVAYGDVNEFVNSKYKFLKEKASALKKVEFKYIFGFGE